MNMFQAENTPFPAAAARLGGLAPGFLHVFETDG